MLTLARESALTKQNAGLLNKYVFIRRKNKGISARSVWKWKKKIVSTSQRSVSASRNKIIFQKLDFPYGFHY